MNHLLVVPEIIYIILLLCSWIAGMFSGIAFAYSIHMKKEKRTVTIWGGIFAVCLLMVFLVMKGIIAPAA